MKKWVENEKLKYEKQDWKFSSEEKCKNVQKNN